MNYEAVVIGTSAGGLFALSTILEALPATFTLPIVVVQHRSKEERTLLEDVLSQKCEIRIKQADEKEKITPGTVYFAPPDYHLLIEQDRTFSLTSDERVNYSRPSIDVLFETAAYVYKSRLLAIILTGANHDGAAGIKRARKAGGTTIAQNPAEAQYPVMPKAAIDTGCIQKILKLEEIKAFLIKLG
ncbi:chemotaxis protein CheB [Botryobacter ruber]|uniref:chemotaxis protein CheB n=1 Tax=Botryobacter ruber TaxID=2171629 RepID=UPI000E0B4AD1|nr:chemotaxis protein CheB [Botryobacter ruber]